MTPLPDDDILLTGWTGNTAHAVLRRLRVAYPDRRIIGVSRTDPERRLRPDVAVRLNLDDEEGVAQLFRDYRFGTVLHLANIYFSPRLLRHADAVKVPRAVCVHTTGMYSRYRAFGGVYQQIENDLAANPPRNTRLTILRPTMIYGVTDETRDHNMHRLITQLATLPVFPVFGSGLGKMQPVHVEDVADAVLAAAQEPKTEGKAYIVSGETVLTYRDAMDRICQELGRSPRRIPVPLFVAVPLAYLYERLSRHPRITSEQILRLQEDKSFSYGEAGRDFGFTPRAFAQGIREEIANLRKQGILTGIEQENETLPIG